MATGCHVVGGRGWALEPLDRGTRAKRAASGSSRDDGVPSEQVSGRPDGAGEVLAPQSWERRRHSALQVFGGQARGLLGLLPEVGVAPSGARRAAQTFRVFAGGSHCRAPEHEVLSL